MEKTFKIFKSFQVLSETLVEIINTRVLSSVYSEIPGNFKIRRKVSNQVTTRKL